MQAGPRTSWRGRLARVFFQFARARRPRHGLSAILLLIPAFSVAADKKLIEFGWDEPDTAFMRAHIAEMEKMPFDGTVFTVRVNHEEPQQDFLASAWGKKAFSDGDFTQAIGDLKSTPFKTFTDNFARFDVTPGDVDWFDDFSAITNNAAQIARVAKLGHAKGVLFDIEQYASPLWDYAKQRDAKKKPFAAYAAKARIRGHEIMDAFQREYPGITIFLTFGYSLPWEEMQANHTQQLADVKYGLLAPFLNGMVMAAEGETKIVDGFEVSYGYRDEKEFEDGYAEMQQNLLPIVADPDKYAKVVLAGFGLWMDYDWRKIAWDTNDFSKNHFTPQQFEKMVRKALARSDEYVWVYTEKPWWWGPGGSKELPDAYIQAVRSARTH